MRCINFLYKNLSIKPYLKGSKYLRSAINIAYYDSEREINISNISKQVAKKFKVKHYDSVQSAIDKTINAITLTNTKDTYIKNLFSSNYKITTKDFIDRALLFIDKNTE